MVVCRSVCFRVVALKARSTYHRVICQESLMQKLWAYLDRELLLKQEQKIFPKNDQLCTAQRIN